MLGGELDGVKGTFGHCRKKGHRTLRRMFALLAMPRWSVGGLQHVVGSFSYACGFRRPLFTILAAVFAEITAHPVHGTFKPTEVSVSEVMLALVTLPFASTNLRRFVRRVVSSSDASTVGGGASEASVFTQSCNVATQALAEGHAAQLNEGASSPQDDVVEGSSCEGKFSREPLACCWHCGAKLCDRR